MTGRRLGAAFSALLAFSLGACSGPVGLYHSAEGGAIAQGRQPPPGADLPYPNLADVPPARAIVAPGAQSAIDAQVHASGPDVSPASKAALAGLALPGAPPPLPNVPGLALPSNPYTPPPPPPPLPPAPPHPNGTPVALAFPPHTAILPNQDLTTIAAIAAARGDATILAGGFGDNASLALGLARARRLADQLTALGVPPGAIRLVAMRAGSGGFLELVY